MTESTDLENWSPFQLLNIKNIVDDKRNNIYFLTVALSDTGVRMVGFFPGVVKLSGQDALSSGLFRIYSTDGLHWDELAHVYHVASEEGVRVDVHPVGIYRDALMTMHHKEADISLAFKLSQRLSDEKDMMFNLSSIIAESIAQA